MVSIVFLEYFNQRFLLCLKCHRYHDAYGLVEKARGRGEAEEEVEEAEVVQADENDNILPPSEDAELGHKARRHRLDSSRLDYD
jgi:hypothetical protein